MKHSTVERSPAPAADTSSSVEAVSRTDTSRPHRRERHSWRLVVGLTGLLGMAWAVAIASRYPNILPG